MEKICSIDFLRDTRGAVLPIFGLMVILLVVIGGSAIDVSRAVNAREKLAYAIDAAALSVASTLSTTVLTDAQIEQALEDSLRSNLDGEDFLETAISNMNYVTNDDNGTITVSSSASLQNYFIGIGGYMKESLGPDFFSFGATNQVTYSRFDVELALVLDVTGSMGSDISALRTAAKDLVKELIPSGTSTSASKVRISVVPYSQGVNLGSDANTVTNGHSGSKNCVTERPGAQQFTDAIYDYSGSSSEFFRGAGDVIFYDDDERTWGEQCPDEAILPLTGNRSALDAKIEALDDNGGTAGQTGIAWGWYTLSPSWASLWPVSSAPAAYASSTSTDDVKKFAVVMTDGDFNDYFEEANYPTTEEQCGWVKKKKKKKTWVCEDVTVDNFLWTEYYKSDATINDQSAARGLEFCTQMKANNIHIYSIYFDTTGSAFGQELMEDCATQDSNSFYYANNSAQLVTAFGNIAKKIQQVYLSD